MLVNENYNLFNCSTVQFAWCNGVGFLTKDIWMKGADICMQGRGMLEGWDVVCV